MRLHSFDPDIVDIGFVHLFSNNEKIPEKTWMLCEGQSIDIDQYSELFKKIGYTFGGEKGYFRLPDYRLTSSPDPAFVDSLIPGYITDRYAIKVSK